MIEMIKNNISRYLRLYEGDKPSGVDQFFFCLIFYLKNYLFCSQNKQYQGNCYSADNTMLISNLILHRTLSLLVSFQKCKMIIWSGYVNISYPLFLQVSNICMFFSFNEDVSYHSNFSDAFKSRTVLFFWTKTCTSQNF